jgi:hypothetical protein
MHEGILDQKVERDFSTSEEETFGELERCWKLGGWHG